MRPLAVCYCAEITEIPTATRVLILQHPRERHVPINTVRIAALCLPNATVRNGVDFSSDPVLAAALADAERPAVLLFPSEDAVDPVVTPPAHPVTLVVLDGTWHQAKKLLRSNPSLRALPCYALAPASPSEYRIRREPAEHYVATLEALGAMLSVLERDATVETRLRAPFKRMVDLQLHYAETVHASRHRKAPPGEAPRVWKYVPEALRGTPERVVFVWGEANAWPVTAEGAPEASLVHWVAERMSGERFEAFVQPVGALSPSFQAHTRLAPERPLAGESTEAFSARWQGFLREGDVLVTWGNFALELLHRRGLEAPHTLDLRDATKRHLKARVGSIENAAAMMSAELSSPWADGRAGARLTALVAIARAMLRG